MTPARKEPSTKNEEARIADFDLPTERQSGSEGEESALDRWQFQEFDPTAGPTPDGSFLPLND
jgi:hypothetical protein